MTLKDGVLSGTMKVTLNPDPWVPADHKARYQDHTIEAKIADGKVDGWYRFTGEGGPDKDRLIGTVEPVQSTIAVDGPTGSRGSAGRPRRTPGSR